MKLLINQITTILTITKYHNTMDIIKQFNLPSYIKGKSFAEASALIAKKFEGRTDPESIATLNDLQGSLQKAQEYVKAEKEKLSKPTHQMPDGSEMEGASHEANEYEGAGFLSSLFGKGGDNPLAGLMGGGKEGGNPLEGLMGGGEDAGAGVSSYIGAAKSVFDVGKDLFGDGPKLDNSGLVKPTMKARSGFDIAKGGVEGFAQGTKIAGPIGGAVLGAAKVASGIIGQGKEKEAIAEADYQYTATGHEKGRSQYEGGGNVLVNMLEGGIPTDEELDLFETENELSDLANFNNELQFEQMGLGEDSLADLDFENKTQDATDAIAFADELKANPETAEDSDLTADNKNKNFNPAEILRYAAPATTLGQLLALKKPEDVGLDRLNTKYKKELVDERQLQNITQRQGRSIRNQILGASDSPAAARAGLLGSQLQEADALSTAYMKATDVNRQEGRAAQEFDKDTDKLNISQSNRQKDINLEQKAAYETNKSKLIAQLGQDVGQIGTEELYKRYPELMGLEYDWRGKYGKDKKNKNTKES